MKHFFLFFSALLFSVCSFGIGAITGPSYVCIGSTVMLSDTALGGTWTSSAPGVASIGLTSGVVNGVSAGTAIITYIERGSMAAQVISVYPHVVPSITIGATTADTVCAGTLVSFYASLVNCGPSPAYQWLLNDSAAGVTDTFSYYPGAGDTIGLIVVSDSACASPDSAYNRIVLTILPAEVPEVTINASPGVVIGGGQWDTLTAVVTTGGTLFSYQWIVNSTVVPGVTGSTYLTDSLANNDSVSCIVTSLGPCGGYSAFNSITITVGPAGVATVNGGNDLSLYPNPNNGVFTLKGTLQTSDHNIMLQITDVLGHTVSQQNVVTNNGVINEVVSAGGLAAGIYSLHLVSSSASKVIPFVVAGR